ncbi:MAG: hypothetical protein K9H25_06745 [Rhodospirillum sp.]|nr:hypothetical protein [Rhodospirillum sp.]MCF8487705.1 hypothetical protein [Rhodospirillum sp.]MCF8502404.1 hypothetical protein [Rhodospirillum sp.]
MKIKELSPEWDRGLDGKVPALGEHFPLMVRILVKNVDAGSNDPLGGNGQEVPYPRQRLQRRLIRPFNDKLFVAKKNVRGKSVQYFLLTTKFFSVENIL